MEKDPSATRGIILGKYREGLKFRKDTDKDRGRGVGSDVRSGDGGV